MKKNTKAFYVLCSLILVSGIFIMGVYVGYDHRPYIERVVGISNKENTALSADFEPFWKVWNTIDEKFPGAQDVSSQDRVYGAIQGLVSSLGDPYSVYFPPQDSKDFEDTIKGSFEGIGMEVGIKDKVLTVIAPLKNTPAENAGIRAGDIIIKIDDTTTNEMTIDRAVKLMRGAKGTVVKLTIYREGEDNPREISVTRGVIIIPTIDTEMRADGIFVVQLYNFSENSDNLMKDALIKFRNSGSKNLIIDLRNNPGGYLSAAINMASLILPKGEVVVSEDFGTSQKPEVYRSSGYGVVDPKKTKIVVLVDKGSASASEILAGALKEHGAAILIGERTYGKGSVQEVVDITKETTLKLTIARWLTPNGVSISKQGIDPDIAVTVTDKDIADKKDPALERAIEYFKNGK